MNEESIGKLLGEYMDETFWTELGAVPFSIESNCLVVMSPHELSKESKSDVKFVFCRPIRFEIGIDKQLVDELIAKYANKEGGRIHRDYNL